MCGFSVWLNNTVRQRKMLIALTVWIIASIITSMCAWLASTSLDFDFRVRYPEEGEKIEALWTRKCELVPKS